MIIREYNSGTDYEGLRKCVIAIQEHERNIEPRMPRGQDIVDEYVPDLVQRCRKYQGKILIADVGGAVAGYVLILCKVVSRDIEDGNMEFGLVGDLVVLEEFRTRGYGAKLLSAAETEAKANDVKWLRIGVLSANHVARNLYLSKGFRAHFDQLEKALS